jgi:hypothetical protein
MRVVVEPGMVQGRLVFAVTSEDGRECAVVEESGVVHASERMSRPFEAVVYALGEWYAADRRVYGGANAGKVKRALRSRGG